MSYRPALDDLQFLQKNAVSMANAGIFLPHLDQRVGLLNYIRIADDIAEVFSNSAPSSRNSRQSNAQDPAPEILDWGCGYGQMSWLLKNRAFRVTSFDIGPEDTALPDIPLCADLAVIRSTHPTALPFAERSFDGVLSCGVLEHVDECSGVVGNEIKSLQEIARVLRPGGRFLIYQLPQKAAWQEAIVRRFKLGYAHPRRYSKAEIVDILESSGFRVARINRANLFPCC